ncbi:MAG TPA: hypothetical protein ENI33_06240 [Thermoplasmatales archaeon]|nr:hypothetical protein [Thermoplasmatales archaeon]
MIEKRKKLWTAIFLVVSLILLNLNINVYGEGGKKGNEIQILEENYERIVISSEINKFRIEEIEENGEIYNLFEIPEFGILAEVGKPQLPAKRFMLVIPPNAEVREINVIEDNIVSSDGYKIYPFQEPCLEGEIYEKFTINETFYSSNIFYPEEIVELSQPFLFHGIKAVYVSIYPLQFNPLLNKINFHRYIKFEIQFENEKTNLKSISPIWENIIDANVFNNGYKKWYSFERENAKKIFSINIINLTDVNNTADYLIITNDNFYPSIVPLAKWKMKKGLETKIVNLTQIYNEFPGNNNYTIKNFISYAYNNWSVAPSYILLIGDVEYLPTNYGLSGCATDLFYSTLYGNDYFPDVMLGRISVKTCEEVDIIVNKTIGYEKNPYLEERAWYKNVTVFYGTERPRWLQTANFIENFLGNYSYNVTKWNEYEGDTSRMASEINAGRFFLNYREHGSPTGWYMGGSGGFYNADVMALVNGRKLPVVFSTTCDTGWLDYSYSDCFGEVWMKKEDGGAIAFVGSSRPSYTGYNDELAKGFYKAIFTDKIYNFAGVIDQGKLYMYNYYGDGYYTRLEYQMYISFTDPELTIWTEVPTPLNVSHPPMVPIGEHLFTVNVKANNTPVENATVTLIKDDEIFLTGKTDSEGNTTFLVNAQSIGNLSITVVSHNHIPYEKNVTVTGIFEINLSTGWNLITLPIENDYTASTLLNDIPSCSIILRWNASIADFDLYAPGSPNDFEIEDGHGYLIAVDNDTNFSMSAMPVTTVSVPLYIGWNMLGWFKEQTTNASSLLNSIQGCSIVLKWNNSIDDFDLYAPGVPDDFVVARGDGFLVAVNQQSIWNGEG